MTNKYAYIFPGQGAQHVGMGKSFHDSFIESRLVFEQANDLLHYDLTKVIFEGPESLLTETKTAQPAIFVTSIAILSALKKQFGLKDPVCTAGLSLGEYTALTAAGVLSFDQALVLVAKRGSYMHDACERTKGSMLVVLGLADDAVITAVEELKLPNDVWCANFNCPGQVVISGTKVGLAAAEKHLKESGAKKILPLQVHGAFHSGLMKEAAVPLSIELSRVTFHPSPIEVAMNTIGAFAQPNAYPELLARQVTSSVLWHQCISACVHKGISHFIEIGCGKTLAGMNKRIGVSIPTLSIETVDDVELIPK